MNRTLASCILFAIFLTVLTGCGTGSSIQVNTPVPTSSAAPGGKIEFPGVTLSINTPGPNPSMSSTGADILMGIWHGIISPITLIVSFTNPNVQMYEVNNNGGPYNLGFLLGVAIVFVLLGVFAGSRR